VKEALPQSVARDDWSVRYEQLRIDVLSQAAAGGLGLVLFLRQGMTAWMRASVCAVASVALPAAKPAHPPNAVSLLPCDVRSQAAVILAGILLSYPMETNLCKATYTK
jgi:hypothetical protein